MSNNGRFAGTSEMKFIQLLMDENALFFFWGRIPKDQIHKIPNERIDQMMELISDIFIRLAEDPEFNTYEIGLPYFCGIVESQENPFFPLTGEDHRVKILKEAAPIVTGRYGKEDLEAMRDRIRRDNEEWDRLFKKDEDLFAHISVKYSQDPAKNTE